MQRLLIAILILLSPCLSFAGTAQVRAMMGMWGGQVSSTCVGTLCEDFDGTGMPSGWSTSLAAGGSVTFDYTPALVAGESLQINSSVDAASTATYVLSSAINTISGSFVVSFSVVPAENNDGRILYVRNAGNTGTVAYVGVYNTSADGNRLSAKVEGATTYYGPVLSVNTSYKIWYEYTHPAVQPTTIKVWVTGTSITERPATPDIIATRAITTLGPAGAISLAGNRNMYTTYDDFKID